MTWALWRTSTAVRLSPAVALISLLGSAPSRPGQSYLLNRVMALNIFMLVIGASLAAALAAVDAGALRRRPALRQVRLSSARSTATMLFSDALPTWIALVGAYAAALAGLCATSSRGGFGWGEAALSASVAVGLGLAVVTGQAVGWLIPTYLSSIVAGAVPYLGYVASVLALDARWAVRALFIDGGWAPFFVPDIPRIILAVACMTASAVVLLVTTTQVLRRGKVGWLIATSGVLIVLLTALAAVPAVDRQPFYARVGTGQSRCATTHGVGVCVLAIDADLLPELTVEVARYLNANGPIPGTPNQVVEVGVPSGPRVWTVRPDSLMGGRDDIVKDLAAQHVSSATGCPTEPVTPEGASGPWSWLVADLLARQAGVEPQGAVPRELADLDHQEARAWLWGATAMLRSCHAPTMP